MNRRNDEPSVVDDDRTVVDSDDKNDNQTDPTVDDVIDLRDENEDGHIDLRDDPTGRDIAQLVDRRRPMSEIRASGSSTSEVADPDLCVAMDVSTTLDSHGPCPLQQLAIGIAAAFDEDQQVELTLLDGRSGQLRPISAGQQDALLRRIEQTLSPTVRLLERRLAKTGLRARRWEPEVGTWFIDLEPAWSGPVARSELLPQLESAGVRISAFIPDLLRLHHPEWFSETEVTNFRQWLRAHRTAASTWLAASLATAEDLVYWLGPRSKNHEVKLITLGVSDEVLDTPMDTPLPNGRLLMIGPVALHNGHRLLLDALTEASRSSRSSSTTGPPVVDIVGALSDDTQLNQDLHDHANIRMHHQLSQSGLRRLWADAAFLLSPCLGDGTGAALVESLARGIPVVATDLPAPAEASQGLATALKPEPSAWATFLQERVEHHPVATERTTRFKPIGWTETAAELRRFLHGLEREDQASLAERSLHRLGLPTRGGP